jgi:outer membrane protein assembly factor BamB
MWRFTTKFSLFSIIILILMGFVNCGFSEEIETFNDSAEQYGEGYRYNTQGWIYVHIKGEPYERGFQHGYLLSDEIVDMLNRWSNTIHKHETIAKISVRANENRYKEISETWWNFCRRQCERRYWDKFPKEYQQEIKGIADGINSKGARIHGRGVDEIDILTLNEMYELMSKITLIRNKIHPIRTLFHNLIKVEPATSTTGLFDFIKNFFSDEPPHHCNGFAATGDATTDGQIVFSQSTICGGGTWWWNYYITLRWNVILDIQPSQGYRVIMSSSPGLIWSDEDYYQNDNGILLLETTNPQGIYDNIGLPLSVRARNAMQYGNSIDEVIYHLRYKNDGCMNAVWLIGDTKTGEIARFELGYTAYATYRTKNGYYWSANNPFDFRVRLEKFTFDIGYIFKFLRWIFNENRVFGYYSIRYIATGRDLEYERLGDKYYGQIDIDILKEIMSIESISYAITDIKLTDTKMLEKNGLWAFWGNPLKNLEYTSLDNQKGESFVVKPSGWVEVYGLPQKNDFQLSRNPNFDDEETAVIWEFDTGFNVNDFSSSCIINNNVLYSTTSEGKLYAIDIENRKSLWHHFVGKNPTKPAIKDDLIFIGHSEGLSLYDMNGFIKWEFQAEDVVSQPIIVDDIVIIGTNIGKIHGLSIENGYKEWMLDLDSEIYISPTFNENIYIASGESCSAISIKDQKLKWTYSIDGFINSAPVIDGNTVYFGSSNNLFYALNSKTGLEKWTFETGWGIDSSPTVSGNLIFVGSNDNNLYALKKKSGELKWLFSCNAAIHSSPVVYGDHVIFGSDDGRIYAVNKSDGEYIWSFAPDDKIDFDLLNFITTPIVSDPFIADGVVYIGANGVIYALDAQTTDESLKILDEDTEIPLETGLFIIISLFFVIALTGIYLYTSKKRFK